MDPGLLLKKKKLPFFAFAIDRQSPRQRRVASSTLPLVAPRGSKRRRAESGAVFWEGDGTGGCSLVFFLVFFLFFKVLFFCLIKKRNIIVVITVFVFVFIITY